MFIVYYRLYRNACLCVHPRLLQVFGGVLDVVVGERGHGVVAVVVVGLVSDIHTLLLSDRFGCFGKVLR